jgi:hypothetical protein
MAADDFFRRASLPEPYGSRAPMQGGTVSAQDLAASPPGPGRLADTVATGGVLAHLVLRVDGGDRDRRAPRSRST